MSLSRDEATPCGDGVFKGVKVAWPGSGGQREEFPLRRVRRFDRFALRAYSRLLHTRTCIHACSLSRVPLMTRRCVASMHLSLLYQRVILVRPRRFICAFGSLTRRFVADRDETSCFSLRRWCYCGNEWRAGTVWHNYLFVALKWSAAINHPQFTRHNHKSSGRIFTDSKQEKTLSLTR